MPSPRRSLVLLLLTLPSLLACRGTAQQSTPAMAFVAARPGVARPKLVTAIDRLFDDDAAGETRALLVLNGGRIVAERYAPAYGPSIRQPGWSASQCVTATMIGMLVSDGRLRLDASAPVPAWQRAGDPRNAISLRMLLQMRSGLRPDRDDYLDFSGDAARTAEALPLEDVPGRRFGFSLANPTVLVDVAARVLAESDQPAVRRQAVAAYLRSRLFEPAGMTTMTPQFDAGGTLLAGGMFQATPRDWAKLGELLRNQGSAGGAQLVPRSWIGFMRQPSPGNPAYGALTWLNRRDRDGSDLLFARGAPRDLFACAGRLGQFVIVSPSQRLTIVRLGETSPDGLDRLRARLLAIIRLFPLKGSSGPRPR